MYTPLKVTTDYSLLKSLIKVDTLMDFLVSRNITACAIVDENLYGVLDFYESCFKFNIKPIIGLEVKLNNQSLYLYAMNYNGYKNLLKIHSIKEQRELGIVDLNNYKDNILVIIPFKSKELFDALSDFDNRYIGYHNNFEKNNALMITPNSVYVEDLRALKVEDLKYMTYLEDIGKFEYQDYSSNYYEEYDFIDKEKIEEVVSLCNVSMPKGKKYIPKYNKDIDSSAFLRSLAIKGLNKRLNNKVTSEYKNRLNYELDIIAKMGFVDYFLIVYDYVLFAKKNNILVGPGRGSAAGSLVSFCLGITDIDPLKYNLLFERFLNPNRITMPDIDIDFDALKREEVIDYVREKYGNTKVALGLTFNTLKSKLVLREVAKILKIDNVLIDKFVKLIDGTKNLKDNLQNINIKKYLTSYEELKKVYQISMHLEGLKKNTSTHAAGVVISSETLDEVIPIHYEQDILITGVTMEYLEDIGLLKMDFLGVKNLTMIANIIRAIGKNVLKDISLDDEAVLNIFASGKTEGIFQYSTPLMKNLAIKLKPKSFSDLVAGVALGRPGPKEHAEEFIRRKEGKESITYIHDDLKDILKETYGILIYQEQIIAILNKIGRYSYQEADLIRRAISKKKEDVLQSERARFIKRAIEKGYEEKVATNIYDLIVKFASYGFNKSHSVAYALIAYQMAYLKVYYPALFLAELLNESGTSMKSNEYISFLKSRGIKIIKPSINNKINDFVIMENKLILPLWLIKNISKDISDKIILAKKDGYADIFDFCYKTKEFINDELLITLINAGAMDDFKINHQTMIMAIPELLNYAALQSDEGLVEKPIIALYPEYDKAKLREDELVSYGFFVNNHPCANYNSKEYLKLVNINNYLFKKIKCVVIINKINTIKTKKGEDMAFIKASDDVSDADFTLFPNNYEMLKDIKVNDLVEIYGEVSKRLDKVSIIIKSIKVLK